MNKTSQGLRATLRQTSGLLGRTEDGQQAVQPIDRARMTVEPPRYVVDSLALDNRSGSTGEWDYLLGIGEQHRAVLGVEVHPATSGEVASVIAKKQRSLVTLQSHMNIADVRHWIWIASGKTTVTKGTTEYRRLVVADIHLAGGHLKLPYKPR